MRKIFLLTKDEENNVVSEVELKTKFTNELAEDFMKNTPHIDIKKHIVSMVLDSIKESLFEEVIEELIK